MVWSRRIHRPVCRQARLKPKVPRRVESVFERRRHVAKAGGAAEELPRALCKSSNVAYGAPVRGTSLAGRSFSALTGGTVRSFAARRYALDAAAGLASQPRSRRRGSSPAPECRSSKLPLFRPRAGDGTRPSPAWVGFCGNVATARASFHVSENRRRAVSAHGAQGGGPISAQP